MPSSTCDQVDAIEEIRKRMAENEILFQKRLGEGEIIFAEIHSDIKQIMASVKSIKDDDLPPIKLQTTATNGRVTKLERLKTNMMYLIIGVAVCSADGPALFKAIISVVK